MASASRKARRAWIAAKRKHVKRGKVFFYEFQHDEWCGIYTPARICNCDPVRVLKDDEGRVLACVEGGGGYDPYDDIVEGVV